MQYADVRQRVHRLREHRAFVGRFPAFAASAGQLADGLGIDISGEGASKGPRGIVARRSKHCGSGDTEAACASEGSPYKRA
eukprot:981560-Pyramimonas_sp.AAC.1